MSIPKTRDKSFDQELFAKDLGTSSRGFSFLEASLSCARVFPGITCLRSLECGERRIAAVYVLVHEDDPTTMKRRIKSAQMNH